MQDEVRNKLSELIEMVPLEDLVYFKSVVNKTIDARIQQASIFFMIFMQNYYKYETICLKLQYSLLFR